MSILDKNSNNLSEVLQGVATLGGERPKENRPNSLGMKPDKAQPQAGKTLRYSGAARRRYKKQKQLEGKGEVEKPAPTFTTASATTPRTGELASTGSSKRHRSEQSTPSPSGALQMGKRSLPIKGSLPRQHPA
ncbi:rni-like protein [Lasius niger]|uniref:Rni-like protein n=1 Tax=Lasius niger TaxID=67767 RepID=A0A0J7N969_LASNI|nr:rni-like protein [Lasius niger]